MPEGALIQFYRLKLFGVKLHIVLFRPDVHTVQILLEKSHGFVVGNALAGGGDVNHQEITAGS